MLLSILICILFVVYLWHRKYSKSMKHPLPPPFYGQLPLIGHMHFLIVDLLNLNHLVKAVAEYCNSEGGVIHLKFGTGIYYVITDPEDALTVANACLQKSYIYDFGKSWLGEGLITGSGETWQLHRKLLNPAFGLPIIHGFLDIFNVQAKELIRNLEPHVGQALFKSSSYVKNASLSVSTKTVFGNMGNDSMFYLKYMKAIDEILHMICTRMITVLYHNDTLYNLLGIRKKENELINTLRAMTAKAIETKRAENTDKTDATAQKCFLDLMIEQLNKKSLTEQEVQNELDTFVAASYETSADFLEIALLLIGFYPEVQDKMYEEILKIVGNNNDVTKEHLQKLVYIEAVIKECLRYIPVVPVFLRSIDKEVKLKNYTLRADTQCIFLTHGMHRHSSWGPDAHQFKPERWLDPASAANNNKAFAGFSIGKRACAGKTYAIISAKVMLVHLLRAFKVTGDPTMTKFTIDITLRPVEGNEISLQRRI